MMLSDPRALQRLRYRQGQMIRSRDFLDQHTIEGELRAWHQRAMHNTYGVAKGFLKELAVEPLPDNSGVSVGSGLAYDSFGRELLLSSERTIAFADKQEPAFLVLSYGKQSRGGHGQGSTADCCSSSGRLGLDATLSWIPVKEFSVSDGVPLAQTEIVGGGVGLKPDFTKRQSRALARPRIASGTTIPGATTWEDWDPVEHYLDFLGGLQVRIDTSSAGFSTVPAYFASLQGPIVDQERNILSLHLDHIDEATPNGFVFRFSIIILDVVDPGTSMNLRKFFEDRAYVSWIGIEPGSRLEAASLEELERL
jgi:hypothetical protein